jgi:hypothetical protein
MQEVFEGLVKDGIDMIDDAISHTDVVALLKYLKVQRAIAENHRLVEEDKIDKFDIIDPLDFVLSNREACAFARIVETFDYVIDLIESGRFAKE